VDTFQRDVFTVLPHFSRYTSEALQLQRLAIQELSRLTDPALVAAVQGLLLSLGTIKEVMHTAEYLPLAAERIRTGRDAWQAAQAQLGGAPP